MKKLLLVAAIVGIALTGCRDDGLFMEAANPNVEPEVFADGTSVSSKQALEIAEKFFGMEGGATTKASATARVETVRDERSGDSPAMHVVTYPEGGFVIVSATKDYFPVLAWSDENPFDLENVSQSGVSVWMEETKDAIRASEDFDAEAKAQIRQQWLLYEDAGAVLLRTLRPGAGRRWRTG
jgi:hypothetical protein